MLIKGSETFCNQLCCSLSINVQRNDTGIAWIQNSCSRIIGSAILIFMSHFSFWQTDLPRLIQVFIFQALRLHLKQKQNYGSGLARWEHIDPSMWFPSGRLKRGEVGRRICANLTVYLKKTLNTANLNVSLWGGGDLNLGRPAIAINPHAAHNTTYFSYLGEGNAGMMASRVTLSPRNSFHRKITLCKSHIVSLKLTNLCFCWPWLSIRDGENLVIKCNCCNVTSLVEWNKVMSRSPADAF